MVRVRASAATMLAGTARFKPSKKRERPRLKGTRNEKRSCIAHLLKTKKGAKSCPKIPGHINRCIASFKKNKKETACTRCPRLLAKLLDESCVFSMAYLYCPDLRNRFAMPDLSTMGQKVTRSLVIRFAAPISRTSIPSEQNRKAGTVLLKDESPPQNDTCLLRTRRC